MQINHYNPHGQKIKSCSERNKTKNDNLSPQFNQHIFPEAVSKQRKSLIYSFLYFVMVIKI